MLQRRTYRAYPQVMAVLILANCSTPITSHLQEKDITLLTGSITPNVEKSTQSVQVDEEKRLGVIVTSSEIIDDIAKRHRIPVRTIMAINKITNIGIKPGQFLHIPTSCEPFCLANL